MIEATFPFNEEVMTEAYETHRDARRWPRYQRLLAWIAGGWGGYLVGMGGGLWPGGTLLAGALIAGFWPRLSCRLWLSVLKLHPFWDAEVRCRFDTTQMVMLAKGEGMRLLWEDTYKIVPGTHGYLIYPKTGAFYYIPARGFSTEIDAERVQGLFLSEKMRTA